MWLKSKHFERVINEELLAILNEVRVEISHGSDMVWTNYRTPEELNNQLGEFAEEIENGKRHSMEKIRYLFLPTMTLQEHSISNGWSEKYLCLANKFDTIYTIANRR